jgi:hypothetical protein
MGTTEGIILSLISLVGWIVIGVRVMRTCEASGVSNGWFAFIPFLNFTRWARLSGRNPWLTLLWIFPPAGYVFSLICLGGISRFNGTQRPWFWVYLVTVIVSIAGAGAFSGFFYVVIALILTLIGLYASWVIFDPSKPIAEAK